MHRAIFLLLLAFVTAATCAPVQKNPTAGAAKIDITPTYPVRMTGYAVRTTEATNAAQPIWAKALALGDKEPALFITVDNCGAQGTMVDDLAHRLRNVGVAPERIAVCSSHTHSAPMVNGFAPNIFATDIPPEHQQRIDRYTKELADKLEQVARNALLDRKAGKLSWAEGEARFAKNRRTQGGPVDHSLPVLRVTDADGKLRAIIANYACHCTTLGGEFNQVHGDWAGYAQEFIQRDHPGAIALISIGCGADANPSPRGSVDNARAHGEELATEVKNLLGRTFMPLTGEIECRAKEIQLPFQKHFSRAEWEARATESGIVGYHAKKNLTRLDRGESLPTTLPYRVRTWSFGDDLLMAFLAGEVVVDYSLRLKKDFDASRLWVSAYANDVPCYIPSVRILQEGGYEAESSLWYYDRPARLAPESEELIVKTVHELAPERFLVDAKKAEFPSPKSPAEALASFRAKADLQIELVASEPLIVDPVAIDWGPDGRLWVVEMHDYPAGLDGKYKPGGRVKVLTDSDGDGKYEAGTLFLDGLPFPTGVMAWKKGALICAAPDILYAEDTDADGKADLVRTNFTGFATHNYQARVNGLTWGLDGWVYGASGLFGGKIKGFPSGKEVDLGGRDFRMKPDTGEIEPVAGLSQQSRVRDDWDNWFGCDNSTLIWHFPLPEHYVRRNPYVPAPEPRVYPVKDPEPNRLYPVSRTLQRFNDPSHVNRTTSACGLEIYRDELLGTNYYGNAFVCEPVHNLVHRMVLEPEGATFSARRAPDEQRSEFLASTDNWFRPVQVRTGPDGALWVVDMYRFVIEHPRWIPTNRLATLHVRAGDDKGRIYRIYPRSEKLRPIRDVTKAPTLELLGALDNPNGPARDLIHRELLARKDVPMARLSALATNGGHAPARGQALWILRERGESEHVAIRDPDINVRCQAIRLYDGPGLPLRASLIQIGRGPNPLSNRTAFEVALIAGNRREGYLADALASIARQARDNRWLKAAVVSSAVPHVDFLLEKLCANEQLDTDLVDKLITTAVRARNQEAIDCVVRNAIPPSDARATERQLWMLRALFDAQGSDEPLKKPELAAVFAQARETAPSGSAAAMALLGRETDKLESDISLLIKLAGEHSAAFQRLRQIRTPAVAALVLKSWSAASPALRQKFVDMLVTREEWSKQLRAAIDQGVVATSEVSLPVRQRLGLKAVTAETSRAEVVARYAKVAELTPTATRGAAVFANNCASCHAFRNSGHAVGPNLAEFAGKPIEDFVLAIVDPNAALEPKFAAYEVETKDGRSFHGIVRGETATGLTIAQANGSEEKILRSDLKELKASKLSLMPEGLEQAIAPQDMADLIAWLKQGAPAPFGSASAEKAARAREAFRKEQSAMRVAVASEQLDYPSWLGRLPLAHCRQTDGKSRLAWEVDPNKTREFRFAAALGFISQPDGEFQLKVNGRPALAFDVTLYDAKWQSADGKVTMSYAVMENNAEDSNGVLTIALDSSLAPGGKPVSFEVVGSASNSQRWFGIYRVDAAQMAGNR